jgi:hypothetical protein
VLRRLRRGGGVEEDRGAHGEPTEAKSEEANSEEVI